MRDTYSPGAALLLFKPVNQFKNDDIICFSFPGSDGRGGETCIQRLIALPGDTLEIFDKRVFVNSNPKEPNEFLRFNYFVRFFKKPDSLYLSKKQFAEGGLVSDNNDYSFTLNKFDADTLLRDSLVKTMEMKMEKPRVFNETVFPYSPVLAWNPDNFGKLYIPAKGDTLALDSNSILFYESIISVFEKNKLYRQNDSIYINDVYKPYYVVKQDYFFVMGDNRDNAIDSRHFGFLPKSLIRGKIIARLKKGNE